MTGDSSPASPASPAYCELHVEDRAPRGLPVLCYAIFLGTFEWGMVIPTLFPLLHRMGAEDWYFGLIVGTFSLTRMLCQPLVGALGDRFDFKVLLCLCLACSALGGVLYALSEVAWFLLMSRVICGLGASCTPLLFAWTARLQEAEMSAAQVRLNTWRSVGTFVGPFSSTLLAMLPKEGLVNELNSAGWCIALANLVGVFLCIRYLDDLPAAPKATSAEIREEQVRTESLWSTPVVWICLLIQVVTALLLAVLEVVPPVVLTSQYRLPPLATSLLFGVASLLVIGLFFVTGMLGQVSRRGLMCCGVVLVLLGGASAEIFWSPGRGLAAFVLPWLLLTVAPAPLIRTPARALYTSHMPQSVQGRMQGLSESAFSFANFAGPILGAHVAAGGLRNLCSLMLLLVFAEALLLLAGFTRLIPHTAAR